MSDIPFGPDGFVDMDALPPLDPDEALAEEVLERLHEVLVASPVRVPSETQWDAMLETALQAPPSLESDWLVPSEAPVQGGTDAGSIFESTDVDADVYSDLEWPGLASELTDLQDGGDEGTGDGDDIL